MGAAKAMAAGQEVDCGFMTSDLFGHDAMVRFTEMRRQAIEQRKLLEQAESIQLQ